MTKIIGIYKITNLANGKCYIGQSVDIARRWNDHLNKLKQNKHRNSHLQSAFLMYGAEAFSFEIIEECSVEMLDELERFYIREFNSLDNGYNQESGGNPNKELSAELKSRISNTLKGKYAGEKHPLYGKHHTAEAREKISKVQIGRKASAETKAKMSKARSGKNNPKATAVRCIELNKVWDTQQEAAKELGINQSKISLVCNGLRNKCGGYHWEFAERS